MGYSCQPTVGGPDSLPCFYLAARSLGNEIPGWATALHSEGENGSLVAASSYLCHISTVCMALCSQRADSVGGEDVPFPSSLYPHPSLCTFSLISPFSSILSHLQYTLTHTHPYSVSSALAWKNCTTGTFHIEVSLKVQAERKSTNIYYPLPNQTGYWFRSQAIFPKCSFHQSLPCLELERTLCCFTKDILLCLLP